MEDVKVHAAHPNGIFGVAEAYGQVVGFVYGEKLTGAWVLASYFATRPDYRGSDVHVKLGAWFIDQAKNRGAKHIFLYADADNKKLINYYNRFGFFAGGTYVEMIKEI